MSVSIANVVKAFVVCVQQMDLYKRLEQGLIFLFSLVLVLNSMPVCH